MSFIPPYEWICYSCFKQNEPGLAKCNYCSCPSSVTVDDLEVYRAKPRPALPRRAVIQGFRRHRYEYVVFLIGALFIGIVSFLPFLKNSFKDLQNAGWLGDFFGGYVGTFISLASVALLLGTLRAQQRASAHQNFENRYFELIKLHRDNVAEFSTGSMQGRKIFVSLFREYQAILSQVRYFSNNNYADLTEYDYLVIAYYALFFGVGPNSSRMFRSAMRSYPEELGRSLDEYLTREDIQIEIKRDAEIEYKPVDGHQSRLGHYYRHLYQTVTYVDDQPSVNDKYQYVKTIRAQLTNYEQALFLVNSLTPLGRAWWDKDLIKKYNLVKNIPLGFFDRYLSLHIEHIFGPDANFEWQEHDRE